MKLIELHANERTYFINPAQITHVEGKDDVAQPEKAYIGITLTATEKSGESVRLAFNGNDALRLFDEIRALQN